MVYNNPHKQLGALLFIAQLSSKGQKEFKIQGVKPPHSTGEVFSEPSEKSRDKDGTCTPFTYAYPNGIYCVL